MRAARGQRWEAGDAGEASFRVREVTARRRAANNQGEWGRTREEKAVDTRGEQEREAKGYKEGETKGEQEKKDEQTATMISWCMSLERMET
jgi:hypothetical protein